MVRTMRVSFALLSLLSLTSARMRDVNLSVVTRDKSRIFSCKDHEVSAKTPPAQVLRLAPTLCLPLPLPLSYLVVAGGEAGLVRSAVPGRLPRRLRVRSGEGGRALDGLHGGTEVRVQGTQLPGQSGLSTAVGVRHDE